MKTYQINKNFNPIKLHGELSAAGVSVITIRSQMLSKTMASSGEIVTDKSATDITVQTIIQAHDGLPTLEDKIGSFEDAIAIKLTTPEWDKYTAQEHAKIDAMIAARAAAVTAPIKPQQSTPIKC